MAETKNIFLELFTFPMIYVSIVGNEFIQLRENREILF